jgi:activator of HSP90 ATPase
MIADPVTRREFAVRVTTCFSGLGLAGTAIGSRVGAQTPPSPDGEIIRTAEAIHQEVVFKATRQRVYEVLTDEKQFGRVVRLSAAMQSGMPPDAKPAEISRELGGAFSLFAGHIVGRQIELVPSERLVQAWRVVDWKPGVFSIAEFQLTEQGGNTKLVFDHTGFPKGTAQHLADGWKGNYWEPMAKVLA